VFAGAARVREGGKGRDLFFAYLGDTLLNRRHREVVVEID
jgi:hypothetical protein